jgi:hyperosmotically inducible protein
LTAAACGGADSRPAQGPTNSEAISAPPGDVAPTTGSSATDGERGTAVGASARMSSDSPSAHANNDAGAATMGASNPMPIRPTDAVPSGGDAGVMSEDVDNTGINARDRHGALTPMDQGKSGAETKITATIRKGIVGEKNLSFTAKHVKVITVGSKVTLRGPVKNDAEKATIESIAKQTAGVNEVDDQLEVKQH